KLLGDLKELAEYENFQSRDRPIFFNNDEDHPDQDKEHLENSSKEIATSNSNQEKEEPPQDFDILTESNAKNLLPIPSDCEVTSEDENNDDLDSSDNKSLPEEDVPIDEFKVYSNPLFDEDEINSDKLDPHCFNVESDFVESLLNRDTCIDSSSKFDFSGELAHVNPEITKYDFDFEEEIRLIENLLYDNSSPRPPEELNAEIIDTIVESIPSLPILVQDEADLFLYDNSIPSGIENFADDLEGDIHFLEELLIDDSILSHESSDSNFEDNPLIPRPPPEPPDAETDVGDEISVVIDELECLDPKANDE
nr:hypothetical protein [Tanacetum cinerariifolium]